MWISRWSSPTFPQIKLIPAAISLSLFLRLLPFHIYSLPPFSLPPSSSLASSLFPFFGLSVKFPYFIKLWQRAFPFSHKLKINSHPQFSQLKKALSRRLLSCVRAVFGYGTCLTATQLRSFLKWCFVIADRSQRKHSVSSEECFHRKRVSHLCRANSFSKHNESLNCVHVCVRVYV